MLAPQSASRRSAGVHQQRERNRSPQARAIGPRRDPLQWCRQPRPPDRPGGIDGTLGGTRPLWQDHETTVEVWPTSALVVLNNSPSHKSRARACFVRFLEALHKRTNRERKGRLQIGPFTITTVPSPLPGVSHSFLTTINETLQLRTGTIRAHIYRDIFGFTTGPAEINLEAIGFSHPVPTSTEAQALQLLLDRATAHAI